MCECDCAERSGSELVQGVRGNNVFVLTQIDRGSGRWIDSNKGAVSKWVFSVCQRVCYV